MISATQLRAARAMLDWTREELALAAKISPVTVKNIEHDVFRPQEQTVKAIVAAFAAKDIIFTEDDGVKFSRGTVKTFNGRQGYMDFLADIFHTMRNGGKTRQFNFSDSVIASHGSDTVQDYNKRMGAIDGLDAKCLVPEGDRNFPIKHCAYKWLRPAHQTSVPYFIYGGKIAMLASPADADRSIVSIASPALAAAFLKQFEIIWQQSDAVLPDGR